MNAASPLAIDDLDLELIRILSDDARLSNRKIARELGITEGTVRGRIKKLQQDRLIAFTAVTSPDLESESQMAFISVQGEQDNIRKIASNIADLPGIVGVLVTMGQFNIFCICLFDHLGSLHATSSEKIAQMPGVLSVETTIAVETVKYDSRVVRITGDNQAR